MNWDSPMTPTPTLKEFEAMRKQDPNIWWRMGCGHHENLLDMALDRITELERQNARQEGDGR